MINIIHCKYMYVYDISKLNNMYTCIGIFVLWKLIHIHMHVHVLVHLYYTVCLFLTNLTKVANWDGFRTGSSPELCDQVSVHILSFILLSSLLAIHPLVNFTNFWHDPTNTGNPVGMQSSTSEHL